MSQWESNFNENYNQNPLSYHQGNGSFEGLSNVTTPQNPDSTGTHSTPQNSMLFIANGGGMYTEGVICGVPEYQLPRNNQFHTPGYNVEISSDILNRAANSQLTPTAGEFFPRSSYQPYNCQVQGPSQEMQTNRISRTYNSSNFVNGESFSRSDEPTESQRMSVQDSVHQQRRSFDRAKKQSKKVLNIEQSKAEGRKKLLQEAAGISVTKSNDSSSSRVTPESTRRQSQSSTNKSCTKDNRTSDNRIFSRTSRPQNVHHQSHTYSLHRKSNFSASLPNRQKGVPAPSQTGQVGLIANNLDLPQNEETQQLAEGSWVAVIYDDTWYPGDDAASQRERLTNQLNRGTLECLVCCEVVRQTDHTWSCHNCYHVLHLRCIIKWANTSKADNGWRCPACQNVTMVTPRDYYCFCGKMRSPDWSRTDTAHSCGELCDRPKVLASEHYKCAHHCTLLCHPGPCPPCTALVTRKCGCGGTSQSVQCGQTQPLVCREVCNKPLICGFHHCEEKCHVGHCQPCNFVIKQECFCGKDHREVICDGKNIEGDKYSCLKTCEMKLTCGEHKCERLCHEGVCGSCQRDPLHVTHCHCGKTALSKEQTRTSCLDPIPSCGLACGHQLPCGQPGNPHDCKAECHEGMCPPCELTTLVRCRCGHMDQELPCVQVTTRADDARCQKKCTKKRTCGKHKCNQMCCIDVDHVCPLPCNHMLSCGKHRCDQLCHRGHCQPCLQSSFEELYCECGSSVLMPPIPCGTKPPPCNKPCSRSHDCDHEVLHMCHSYPTCPPCGVLTAKYCHGKHELRKAVPCHMSEFSCGLPCGKPLVCGRHKCIQPCHNNECAAVCKQPCSNPRDICGHPCNLPCHDGDCIDSPCKEKVVVTCECGHRSMSRPCFENNSEYQRIATALLASKMADVQLGRSVNLGDMKGPRKITIKTLECTEECRVLERNRRLAIGLQIRNPDLSAKLTPRYSDFMRALAKKDPRLCQHVHEKLTELVKLAKESKQKSRSYSFETMNREKRQFVHEYCTHFGCESVAYDAEPKRNVVATAQRDKSWLPSYSLLEVVQREMGQRKIPLPNLNSSSQKTTPQSEVLPVRVALNQPVKNSPTSDTLQVDYFDFNG